MKRLFWGVFFIFVNFNLNVGACSINLLPEFVGYLLFLKGAEELEAESERFAAVRPYALGMAVYSGILWVGNIIGLSGIGGIFGTVLDILSTVFSLCVLWIVIRAVRDMELQRGEDLEGSLMQTAWFILLAARAIGCALTLLPLNTLAFVVIFVGFAGVVAILVAFYRGHKRYESLQWRKEI